MDEEHFEALLDGVTSHFRQQHMQVRWYDLCEQYAFPQEWAVGVYYLMQKFYLLPEGARHYHTFEGHIYDCLSNYYDFVDQNPHYISHPFETQYSIFMHDIICSPVLNLNEAKSAMLAKSLLTPVNLAKNYIIEEAIIGTYTSLPPFNRKDFSAETKVVCDVDLVGMSLPYADFVRNGNAIREEFRTTVSEHNLDIGRVQFLRRLLDRGYIYHTDYYRDTCEELAVENIKRFIDENS